jgi:hypothetical protein
VGSGSVGPSSKNPKAEPEKNNITFHKIPSINNYYYEKRDISVKNNYSLPFIPTGDINLTFAISVFTHLVKNDANAYLREINRIISDDGAAFVSARIIDEYFFRVVEKTGNHRSVKEEEDGCYYAYQDQDFFAGYSDETWRTMIDEAGLKIISYEAGKWVQKPGARNYQDTFVLVKKK